MTGATISSNTQAGWVSTDEIPSTTCLGQEIETSWQGGVWNLENRDHSSEFVESKSCAERYCTSSRFLTHNFSCRRVNVLFLWCYVLTHKFSFHGEKDCLRSPDCEKTGQLATRKRYASERACFRPSTAQIPVKIYRSNAKSYSKNDIYVCC